MRRHPVIIPDWRYWATITRIVEGDTFYAHVDLGFGISVSLKLRLDGVNTPEIRGEERPEGLEAKKFVENCLGVGDKVIIQSYKDGGFGRWAAKVWFYNDGKNLTNLNDHLVEHKMATYAEGYERQ